MTILSKLRNVKTSIGHTLTGQIKVHHQSSTLFCPKQLSRLGEIMNIDIFKAILAKTRLLISRTLPQT